VLRITLPTRNDQPVYVLEGRLAGEWVAALRAATDRIPPGTACIFDIENVFYVDPLGEKVLLWLNELGASFITQTAYGKDLCRRLHLRRTSAASRPRAPNAEEAACEQPHASPFLIPPTKRSSS